MKVVHVAFPPGGFHLAELREPELIQREDSECEGE
jgi:hypothetical protein